jgi:hypothetical protein
MDPVPDPRFVRKCGSAGNRTRTSASLVRLAGYRCRGPVWNKECKTVKPSPYQAVDVCRAVRRRGPTFFGQSA